MKDFANKLINLPKEYKQWVIKHIAPETLLRWSKQSGKLIDKIKKHKNGEPLSELAILEGSKL